MAPLMLLATSLPESLTPWFVMISTFIGMVLAGGTLYALLRKKAAKAFSEAVMDVLRPLLDDVREDVKRERTIVADALADRARITDNNFDDVKREQNRTANRLDALEIRQSKDTQRVVQAVEAASQVTNGDAT